MAANFRPLIASHADGVLRSVILGRKSKPNLANENESIEASMDDAEKHVLDKHEGPKSITRLGEQISGMVPDRDTIRRCQDLMDAGEVDVIITEDIGRIFRNPRHMWAFVQDCVDANVRLIAVADNIDTADEDWETALSIATVRHGFAVPDASRRVRRSAIYAFRNGGNVQKVKFGYRKLSKEEAASGLYGPPKLRIAKVPELTPVLQEIRRMVVDIERFRSYADIAIWLNDEGFDPGPYSTSRKWTGPVVSSIAQDDILAGFRTFQKSLSKRVYKTGKCKKRRNDGVPEKIHYPELAHFTMEEWTELQAAVALRAGRQKGKKGREHSRFDVPRHKALFPAQHMRCMICQHLYYPCARGRFKCKCSFKKSIARCWNHVEVDAELTRIRVIGWLITQFDQLPDFRKQVAQVAWDTLRALQARSGSGCENWSRQIAGLEKDATRLARAYRTTGSESILTHLTDVEKSLAKAKAKLAAATAANEASQPFLSLSDVNDRLEEALLMMASRSFEFADFLRRILVRFEILPVQAIDSGLVRPRAFVTFACAGSGGDKSSVRHIEAVIDLFDPPKHVRHLGACVQAHQKVLSNGRRPSYKHIAAEIGIDHMTVMRAIKLNDLMIERGISRPYVELRQQPASASRWKPRPPAA